MKTPDTTKAVSSATRQGAQIIGPGGLPAKLNTVTAEVLARLLNYERLTSLDAVFEASTTRLSAVTFYIVKIRLAHRGSSGQGRWLPMAEWRGWPNTSLTRKSWPAQWLPALATGAPRQCCTPRTQCPCRPGPTRRRARKCRTQNPPSPSGATGAV